MATYSGGSFSVSELVKLYQATSNRKLRDEDAERLSNLAFHPYGASEKGWRGWESSFCAITEIISGKKPKPEAVKFAKGLVMKMASAQKNAIVDEAFVLGFLPYLMAGFSFHKGNAFIENSNRAALVNELITSQARSKKTHVFSFLCSHRDPKISKTEYNLLQKSIPRHLVRRAVSLSLGLVANLPSKPEVRLTLMQQGASRSLASSIFPEVVFEYAAQNRFFELVNTVADQYRQISEAISFYADVEGISVGLRNLDQFRRRLDLFLVNRYGTSWRKIDYIGRSWDKDPIVKLAIEQAYPSIKRLMPSVNMLPEDRDSRASEFLKRALLSIPEDALPSERKKARDAALDFCENFTMTGTAKAVYETSFYFLWGQISGRYRNALAIGLDRDHDSYQVQAWAMGAASNPFRYGSYISEPIYAKRMGRPESGLDHTENSFRQFWRQEPWGGDLSG